MFLLQELESFMGDTELWPASILNHLLIDAPTAEIVKKVTAFFNGNNVPFHIASYFYEIYTEYTGDFAINIINIMHSHLEKRSLFKSSGHIL